MLKSSEKVLIALDTTTDLWYNLDIRERENKMTKKEYQQAINNLWEKWDNTSSDVVRGNIQVSIELLDSAINELENKC